MHIRAIISGATGMVGEGVLIECLQDTNVEKILVINRKPGGVSHPKLQEVVHADFFDLTPVETELMGYNACFFCSGVSSVGRSQEEYRHTTYDLTLHFGRVLAALNPEMTFCYVSGAGTDSSEHGRIAWARVKGATENALLRLFKKAYMFRPGFLRATSGQKHVKAYYKLLDWLYPIGRALYPAGFCSLRELGQAMIHVATEGYTTRVLEVKDIVKFARAGR